jgi:integrase
MKRDPRLAEFERWLLDNTAVSTSTARVYAQSVGTCLKTTGGHMRRALSRQLAQSTKIALHSALTHWAQFTEDAGLAEWLRSPEARRAMHDKRTTTERTVRQPLEAGEVDRVLEQVDLLRHAPPEEAAPWIWPVVRVELILGLRANSDVTWISRSALVQALNQGAASWSIWTKGDKQRSLPVEPVRTELLLLVSWPSWQVVADLIAGDVAGIDRRHRVAYDRLRFVLKVLSQRAGLDPEHIHSHRFRHSAALRLYEASGHNLIAVQQLLGHANLETTKRYLQHDYTREVGQQLVAAYATAEKGRGS